MVGFATKPTQVIATVAAWTLNDTCSMVRRVTLTRTHTRTRAHKHSGSPCDAVGVAVMLLVPLQNIKVAGSQAQVAQTMIAHNLDKLCTLGANKQLRKAMIVNWKVMQTLLGVQPPQGPGTSRHTLQQ